MAKYKIEVSSDIPDAENFVKYLDNLGHEASVQYLGGCYVDGVLTESENFASTIFFELWNEFCSL